MVIIFENLSADQADTYRLVLSSSGISHHSKKGKHGWDILVNDTEHKKAINTIEQYLKENRNSHVTDESFYHEYHKTFTGLWVSAILLASHVAITTGNDGEVIGLSHFARRIIQERDRPDDSCKLHAPCG